ncbi:MAG: DEAD/DEAH box helicase family protein [Luteimonas sp.]
MTADHCEIAFESAIEQHLLTHGGYTKSDATDFDAARALFPAEVLAFVQATQPREWAALTQLLGDGAGTQVLDDLCRALASPAMGALHVLRHGFPCFGKTLRLAYFAPASGMNPETAALYAANRLTVTRQLYFCTKTRQSLDIVLALNGLPVLTAELKNPMSGQDVFNAIRQYRSDRDPREPIFRFKERALVHFAVDSDQAFMSTRLDGKATHFLPFNRGNGRGAGNPANPHGHRSAYLWEDLWQRDSLLELLGRYLHLEVVSKDVPVTKGGVTTIKRIRKETMIFPRYHQRDAVQRLIAVAKAQGAGRNYLIQHSAGSGKSNTIAWLAHRLASLHDATDAKVFDTVVVITDRKVLDQQLQDTLYQFEHRQGVVRKIDENSAQLAEALAAGVPIIITTLQKFPFVADKVAALPARRYAVIVDEAHSSQSGEQAAELKAILSNAELRAKANAIAAEEGIDGDVFDGSDDEAVLLSVLKRGKQPNLSYFAFTATPKYKTLKVFDEPGPDGQAPFHLYSMRQAIEEGFIHDVLKHYVTYKTYFRLAQAAGDDREVERREAAKSLARYMQHHPHNLASKIEVMIEHFRQHTRHKIGGRAKAMVVTDSRLSAVRYKQGFDAYIADKGYTDIHTLVAFSGSVDDPDVTDRSYTEAGMNGFPERELPEQFGSELYQVLLVAEKYQTGFDQPLLHTMYVDKRLDGVQAVQTLSRLNRTATGKQDTFVLDFRNEAEDIFRAFKPYYEFTEAEETVSPTKLYELKAQLDGAQVYWQAEMEAFCKEYFRRAADEGRAHGLLNRYLDPAVERFKALAETEQDEFRGWLVAFRNLYGFLSQIIPFQDSGLERLFTYARFLATKLPHRQGQRVDLGEDVELMFYRLQKISEGQIRLEQGESQALYGPSDVGTGRKDEPMLLSTLIDKLNERFGTQFTPSDQLFFDAVEAEAAQSTEVHEVAQANSYEDFQTVMEKELEGWFIDRMEGNDEVFRKVMGDEALRKVASDYLLRRIYDRVRPASPADGSL